MSSSSGFVMKSFNAHGVITQWPFEPYDQQREYCKRVIEAIQKKQNAILESPTGTGKTMSLLVSSLAWQQCTSEAKSIYYLSRTHIQLSQAAKEMKRTAYSRVPAVVLASRQHLCLNSDVKTQSHGSEASLNRSCRNAIARNACIFYTGYEDKLKAHLNVNKVHDIEDLDSFGRQHQCCPYYASKKIAETQAAIVFMPYNYVLDLSVRKSAQLKLDKSVLIVDEGHNLESSLKEAASAYITLSSLKRVEEGCSKIPHELSEALMRNRGLTRRKASILDEDSSRETSRKKKSDDKPSIVEELSEKLTTLRLEQVSKCSRILMNCKDLLKTDKGCYIDTKCDIYLLKAKLEEAGVIFSTSDAIIETLENMSTFWSVVGVVNAKVASQYIAATSSLSHFISLFYPTGTLSQPNFERHLVNLKKNYSVYMTVEDKKDTIFQRSANLTDWKMSLWCLNPGTGMKRVIDDSCMEGPRSIIITSGTLAPVRRIETDLEKKFTITQEFGHLIRNDQIKIKILSQSPHDFKLEATFKNKDNSKFFEALGETLASLMGVLPFGTLVFFPSYRLMNEVWNYCKEKPYWRALDRSTKVFRESSDQSSFSADMMKYKSIVDGNGRAAFMGVCRGKLSEGTNLERNQCRSVIIVGLPFPNRGDAQLIETLAFHESRGDKGGKTWYTSQMRRSLSQAIGRVIRNKDDFGMVFLCDLRFVYYKLSVSKWIQEHYPDEPSTDYKLIADDIKEFFTKHGIDVSASSLARAGNSAEQGAFEFAAPVRRKSTQLALPALPKPNVEPKVTTTTRSFAERQAELIASYTVDRETYKRLVEDKSKPPPETETPIPKKLKTSDLFELICKSPSPNPLETRVQAENVQNVALEPLDEPPNTPNLTRPQNDEPKSQNGKQKCYICKNNPVHPHLTNCRCSRLGCLTCLKALNNKACGDCGVKFKLKHFKPRLFNMFKKK